MHAEGISVLGAYNERLAAVAEIPAPRSLEYTVAEEDEIVRVSTVERGLVVRIVPDAVRFDADGGAAYGRCRG